jgi:hypothetical protein
MASLAGYDVDTDIPAAYGDASLAFGLGAKSHVMGSMAIGISNSAGAKGFYWHSIDWSGSKPIIQLSTKQEPYRYYVFLGTRIEQNTNATWNESAKTLLQNNWQVGDQLTIVNNVKYGQKATITAIDYTNGKITVSKKNVDLSNYATKDDAEYKAGANIQITADRTISATDTTYSAKADGGLKLEGTEFAIDDSITFYFNCGDAEGKPLV